MFGFHANHGIYVTLLPWSMNWIEQQTKEICMCVRLGWSIQNCVMQSDCARSGVWGQLANETQYRHRVSDGSLSWPWIVTWLHIGQMVFRQLSTWFIIIIFNGVGCSYAVSILYIEIQSAQMRFNQAQGVNNHMHYRGQTFIHMTALIGCGRSTWSWM